MKKYTIYAVSYCDLCYGDFNESGNWVSTQYIDLLECFENIYEAVWFAEKHNGKIERRKVSGDGEILSRKTLKHFSKKYINAEQMNRKCKKDLIAFDARLSKVCW